MKIITLSLLIIFNFAAIAETNTDENIRYILIEAKCKPGFKAKPQHKEKVILTKIFKKEFDNAFEVVNAEPQLIIDFEVALEASYPNQRNQVEDILVYMLNTEKEAKELYKRKQKLFETLEKEVIELKVD
jgi:hypothetical protein